MSSDPAHGLPLPWIIGGATLALAAFVALLVFAWPQLQAMGTQASTASNLAGALGEVPSEVPVEAAIDAAYEGPTSTYIEAGLDLETLDDLALGFDEEEHIEDFSAPRQLSDQAIQRVITDNQRELLSCYAEALDAEPDLAGQVHFDFAVAPDGRVAMVRVSDSTLRSKHTEDCFVDRARQWQFPRVAQSNLTRFQTDFNFRL